MRDYFAGVIGNPEGKNYPTPEALTALREQLPLYSINPLMGQWNLTNGVRGIMTAGGQMMALADMVDLEIPPYDVVNELVTFQLNPGALNKGFATPQAQFEASYLLPTLGMTNTDAEIILADGTQHTFPNDNGVLGVEAVSTLLQRSAVNNEWTRRDPTGAAGNDWTTATNWVLSFPTKRFYVDLADSVYAARYKYMPGLPDANSLFGKTWSEDASCHAVGYSIYDREEYQLPPSPVEPPFSPSPFQSDDPELCTEVAILQFGDKTILNSGLTYGINKALLPGSFGWMSLDLTVSWPGNTVNKNGLPVTGFALYQRVVDADAANKNDVFAVPHAYERNLLD